MLALLFPKIVPIKKFPSGGGVMLESGLKGPVTGVRRSPREGPITGHGSWGLQRCPIWKSGANWVIRRVA